MCHCDQPKHGHYVRVRATRSHSSRHNKCPQLVAHTECQTEVPHWEPQTDSLYQKRFVVNAQRKHTKKFSFFLLSLFFIFILVLRMSSSSLFPENKTKNLHCPLQNDNNEKSERSAHIRLVFYGHYMHITAVKYHTRRRRRRRFRFVLVSSHIISVSVPLIPSPLSLAPLWHLSSPPILSCSFLFCCLLRLARAR